MSWRRRCRALDSVRVEMSVLSMVRDAQMRCAYGTVTLVTPRHTRQLNTQTKHQYSSGGCAGAGGGCAALMMARSCGCVW